ncbi:MAG: hypothetical protein AB7M12_13760 [Hyphomonadaceae bacterium]
MTAEPPPGEKPTLDPIAKRTLGAAFVVSLYGVLAAAFIGVGVYFAVAEHEPITSPRVFVALIGALYMGFRAWMIFSKQQKGASDAR